MDSSHIREEGPFREWSFTLEELLAWVNRFLQRVGYELEPPATLGPVCPDFHAKRKTERITFEVVGMVAQHLDAVPQKCADIKQMKASLGDAVDYAIALPPVNETLLIDFFTQDRGKYYFDIEREKISIWLCNPEEETVWCFVGGPRDRRFNQHFVSVRLPMNFGEILKWRLGREEFERLMEEE
jgi:hypothetical protein